MTRNQLTGPLTAIRLSLAVAAVTIYLVQFGPALIVMMEAYRV